MIGSRVARRLAGLAILATLGGPVPARAAGPSADGIEQRLERELPGARFELEERVLLGRLKLAVARAALRVADDPEARRALRGVRRVEIADYLVDALPVIDEVGALDPVEGEGWVRMIRNRDEDELLWVYTHEDRKGLDALVVVELDDSSLSVVRVEGRIDRWLEALAAEDPAAVRDLF